MPCSPPADGLAQALIIGGEFVRDRPSCIVLGNNILYGHGLHEALRRADARTEGASFFAYWVENVQQYGVVEFDKSDLVLSNRRETASSEVELGCDWALFLRGRGG